MLSRSDSTTKLIQVVCTKASAQAKLGYHAIVSGESKPEAAPNAKKKDAKTIC